MGYMSRVEECSLDDDCTARIYSALVQMIRKPPLFCGSSRIQNKHNTIQRETIAIYIQNMCIYIYLIYIAVSLSLVWLQVWYTYILTYAWL